MNRLGPIELAITSIIGVLIIAGWLMFAALCLYALIRAPWLFIRSELKRLRERPEAPGFDVLLPRRDE